ncbi:membrane protein [Pusillimonas sp. T7-7]|uniref:cell division protein ZipA C-terminal FtsZ-binding domain-containing protein n=1 Tax=Pusillimonas sp. (strain T7-7) TaxID=1007105 RepID=UPI0002085561|nr:cell division protein ZipA C-terminal FtsZ-binding domain-containing protein [Pusillimonas sp. T7-7]AEC20278.1 membrane protein [Pusillimonas sp. T7-7]
MSDLQIGLIILGIVLILVVLIFNWWQDRQVRQKMQEHFPEREHDPLMSGGQTAAGRREPGFGLREPEEEQEGDDTVEVDPTTEVVIDIAFAQAVPSASLHTAIQSLVKPGSKAIRIFAEREGGGHRARLRPNEAYVSMQMAVLLANRSGALTDIEWSQLWTAAQGLAERFDGVIEAPEQTQVLARAVELDQLCAALDAQVGLILRLHDVLTVAEISGVLKEVGFLPYGRQLAWMSDTGLPRFTAMLDGAPALDAQSSGVSRVDLVLDLPNSPADEQAFSRMASVGRDLSRRLKAELLDDQGHAVSDTADQAIDEQLLELYGRLGQAGFEAGTERTVRVFS